MIRFLILVLLSSSFSLAQSVWLEGGLGYNESLSTNLSDSVEETQANQNYEPFLHLGLQANIPINNDLSLYVKPFWQDGFGADAGVWIDFPGRIQDLEGFNSFMAVGLSYINLRNGITDSRVSPPSALQVNESGLGFAISAGISYDLNDLVAATVRYTHRPIILPSLAQAFDVSLGLRLSFEP